MMSLAKLTSKGQITLPRQIRDHLELHAGDKVEFVIDPEGRVLLSPKTISIKQAFGMVKAKRSVSINEMNAAIVKKASRKAPK